MVKPSKKGCFWDFRNDSSSVAAILQPQFYYPSNSSSTPTNITRNSDEELPPEERYCLGDNNCYCKEAPTKPRLFSRPRSCIFDSICEKRNPMISKIKDSYPKFCVCDNSRSIFGESSLKISQNSGVKSKSKSKSKSHKRNGEESQDFLSEKFRSNIQNHDENKSQGNNEEENYNKYDSNNREFLRNEAKDNQISTLESLIINNEGDVSVQNYYHKESPLKPEDFVDSGDDKKNSDEVISLKKLNDFRTDHYFETHSTEDLLAEKADKIPDHKCVHKFGLDDRLLPEALNFDVYGVSRCVICGKPMGMKKNTKDHREATNYKGENHQEIGRNKPKTNLFPKFYQYGLAPKKVFTGGGNDVQIEMVLDGSEGFNVRKSQNRPEYFNTYALRFQKGVY